MKRCDEPGRKMIIRVVIALFEPFLYAKRSVRYRRYITPHNEEGKLTDV